MIRNIDFSILLRGVKEKRTF